MLPLVLALLGGYLLGCFSTGYCLVRLRTGADVRAQGSGSTGARNVGRVLGKGGFALVFTGDLLKGTTAVWLAGALGAGTLGMALATLAVVAGHIFPVQLGFRGGKGACTSFGALLLYDPRLAVLGALVCVALLVVLRHAVAAFLTAFTFLPLLAHGLGHPPAGVAGIVVLWALVLLGFRGNVAAFVRRERPAVGRVPE